MDNKIKIFVTYHNYDFPVFKTDIFQPIMGGNQGKPLKEGFIGDDTGDNISNLNKSHAELTIHYWLSKNYLSTANEEYIGLCNYRRFLDFAQTKYDFSEGLEACASSSSALEKIYSKYFLRFIFENYTEKNILSRIKGYDIITTKKWSFRNTNRLEFDYWHPGSVLDNALDILKRLYPDYEPYAEEFFNDTRGYYCLCFIMKKVLLESFFEWQFKIVEELDKIDTSAGYTDDHYLRTPAFIMERFYNIWVRYQIDKNKILALELPAYKLHFDTSPDKKIKYIKTLANNNKAIEKSDIDEMAARHPVLNRLIKPLVKQNKYYKLLGDPKSFFHDSKSLMIRLFGVLYK